jgi:hypothetical protein
MTVFYVCCLLFLSAVLCYLSRGAGLRFTSSSDIICRGIEGSRGSFIKHGLTLTFKNTDFRWPLLYFAFL